MASYKGKNLKHGDKETQKHEEEQRNVGLSPYSNPASLAKNNGRDPYKAFRFRDFRLLFIGSLIANIGEQMVSVAIGWELYERTGSALALGGVGLVQVIPVILLSLPAGHMADRLNRKHIVIVSQVVLTLASLGLMALSFTRGSLLLIYGCLFIMGVSVAFANPASTTLLPQTVPEHLFENAATLESGSWQLASVFGPALGGLMIGLLHGTAIVYGLNAGAALISGILVMLLRGKQSKVPVSETTTVGALLEGFRFLRNTQVILAAITLDMFAVLLGGATTLLPIYAKDILHVGPTGLGWLRAAPSIGALCVSLSLVHLPPLKKAGRTLLWVVAGFGVATCIFGVSHSFWLSLLMLCAPGWS